MEFTNVPLFSHTVLSLGVKPTDADHLLIVERIAHSMLPTTTFDDCIQWAVSLHDEHVYQRPQPLTYQPLSCFKCATLQVPHPHPHPRTPRARNDRHRKILGPPPPLPARARLRPQRHPLPQLRARSCSAQGQNLRRCFTAHPRPLGCPCQSRQVGGAPPALSQLRRRARAQAGAAAAGCSVTAAAACSKC